ncbi:MAG TPA: hypothetical protein GXZ21_12410 [Clostridiales bacterium]|nr:hypothetical protein [Clostridiales bacterium]
MQKTKLGISVGLLGALIYFMGMVNTLGLIIMVGYVLLKEENPWLRKSAVKAVVIVAGFTVVSVLISSGNQVFDIFNTALGWFQDPMDYTAFKFRYPFGIETIVRSVLYIIESLLLIILGFKALTQGSIKIGAIDDAVNKHMD